MNLTTALNIDLYDPNEDKKTLKERLNTLAKLLEKQKPPFSDFSFNMSSVYKISPKLNSSFFT